MNPNHIPTGFTIRTRDQKGRLVYRPDLDNHNPWVSYRCGIIGKHYQTVKEARLDGFGNLETDHEREERAKNLREVGMDIPSPIASIPDTNDVSRGRLPLAKAKG